ncbi:MAG: glycoside hydrolase family 3 C-terminal domain-containing protein [Saprospiraceae bacterium]|nr:glycoside hydrolase family 3 C-terminal domain-containing protein [Saprospiraceae bacterium]
MKHIIALLFALCLTNGATAQQSRKDIFIDSLINLMTLEEKIGQTGLFTSDWDVTGPTLRPQYKEDIKAGKVGAVFNAYTAKYTRELQKIAVENTRLKIPLLFGYDVIHGHQTIFPISLGESCSWDLPEIENAARVAADEASAQGLHWTYAPMVDIARDPRWGRISEGAGEDTYLGSLIGAARVRGFQGKNLSDKNTIAACVKHYAAYGAAQAGRDYHTVDISLQSLYNTYLPPFKACVDEGVATVMTSFNELNGIPASGNPFLLKDVLRTGMGFKGFVVSDYTSINEMVPHGFSSNEKEAGEQAFNAGVDMDLQGAVYLNHLAALVKEGKVKISDLNAAVKRILSLKYDLGLFQDPYRYSDETREKQVVMSAENLKSARRMAQKSIVLLKNQNQALPLKKGQKIALIGPFANEKRSLIGSWSAAGDWTKSQPLLPEMQLRVPGMINYAKGCNINDDSTQYFQAAIQAAQNADVVVLCLGESWEWTGEAASRATLGLPGAQTSLFEKLHATGKPIVVVLMNGRPLCIPELDAKAAAIVETWYLGTMSGQAIADVLLGDYNPSGRLTVTFPRHEGQIPIFYNMKHTGRPFDANNKYTSKYLDMPNEPLYPFGYGLGYTTFSYSSVTLDKTVMRKGEKVKASVVVTNTGKTSGEETVQLYIHDLVGSSTRPEKELKGFQKIMLQPGEQKTVSFDIDETMLAYYNYQLELKAEPGAFQVMIGRHSADTQQAQFELK